MEEVKHKRIQHKLKVGRIFEARAGKAHAKKKSIPSNMATAED